MPRSLVSRIALIGIPINVIIGIALLRAVAGDVLITFGTCLSPFGKHGYCMHLTDCPHLVEMVDTFPDIVKRSYCGPERENVKNKNLFCCVDVPIQNETVTVAPNNDSPEIPPGNVLPEPGECGLSFGNRIQGGVETDLDEFPWTVLIKYSRPYNAVALSCAGALINSRYVISAAHCVRSSVIPTTWKIDSIRLGEWNITEDPDCRGGYCAPPYVEIKVERVIIHQRYLPDSYSEFDDIALLRMERSVKYSSFIRPICLPRWPELRDKDYTGVNAEVAGWGATEIKGYSAIKVKITLQVWEPDKCIQQFAAADLPLNKSLQLCAGGLPHVDTCRGDSGAPLIIQETLNNKLGGYFLIGIVSFGMEPCGMNGWPGIYTRVTQYIDWIEKNIES